MSPTRTGRLPQKETERKKNDKDEKKNAGRTKAKPAAILIRKKHHVTERTISLGATLLLAGMAPIWLLTKERANVWERQQNKDETATLLDIKREAQAALLQE